MGDEGENPKVAPLKLLLQMSQQSYSKTSKKKALTLMNKVAREALEKSDPAVHNYLDIIIKTTKSRQTGKAIKMIGRYAQDAIRVHPPAESTTP